MKKILILAMCFLFLSAAFVIGDTLWLSYSRSRHPTIEDRMKADINTAIAIQKIAEEGLVLHVIIEERTH